MSIDYNIRLTDSALKKIRSLIEQEESLDYALRITVSGGGCSGFKYNFLIDQIDKSSSLEEEDDCNDDFNDEFEGKFEEGEDYRSDLLNLNQKSKDILIRDKDGNPLLMIDNYSVRFLDNSVIDYAKDLRGSGFQVKNALAKSRCGCGNSFSI